MDQEFYSGGSALAKGREMTAAMLERTPELDFLYYSNDMIGAGGLLHLLDKGIKVPGQVGLAGFNGVELLDGLPRRLATMDACRTEIGVKAAQIIAARVANPIRPGRDQGRTDTDDRLRGHAAPPLTGALGTRGSGLPAARLSPPRHTQPVVADHVDPRLTRYTSATCPAPADRGGRAA